MHFYNISKTRSMKVLLNYNSCKILDLQLVDESLAVEPNIYNGLILTTLMMEFNLSV